MMAVQEWRVVYIMRGQMLHRHLCTVAEHSEPRFRLTALAVLHFVYLLVPHLVCRLFCCLSSAEFSLHCCLFSN